MTAVTVQTLAGPMDVEGVEFGQWAATRHAGEEVVLRECGVEVGRFRRAVRGWDVTHTPSGTSLRLRLGKRKAIQIAKALDASGDFHAFGANWKPGRRPTKRDCGAALRLLDFLATLGVAPELEARVTRGWPRRRAAS